MRRRLENCRVLITGASSGIGRALAHQFARKQARILLLARREARLQEVKREVERLGGTAIFSVGDVTSPSVRQTVVELCNRQFGGLDLLVNNAGIGAIGTFEDSNADRLRQIMDVNFFAPVELIRLTLPLLRKSQTAAIVNICSVLGHRAVPLKSEYCASKFALHGFSDALRAELVSDGIDVILVSPSTTESEFFDQINDDPSARKRRSGMSPDRVASATMRAIEKRRHEVIFPFEGKALVWLDRYWPSLADRIVARFG